MINDFCLWLRDVKQLKAAYWRRDNGYFFQIDEQLVGVVTVHEKTYTCSGNAAFQGLWDEHYEELTGRPSLLVGPFIVSFD